MYPATAAVRQGCTRGAVIMSSGACHLWCGFNLQREAWERKCKDGIAYKSLYLFPHISVEIAINIWTCYEYAHAVAAQQKYGVW